MTLYKIDENNNDKGWIEYMITTRVDIEKLEDSIDNIGAIL